MAKLYRGTGDGRFEEVADRYNLAHPAAPMGSNFGDLDNDGYLDFYLGTGYPNYHSVMPNVMYRNLGGNGFANVTYAGGFGHLQKGHAVVFADLDHDGDQDVFEQMGGAFPGDQYGNVLYENPGFGNHWTTIKLVGVQSNRSGIGARIRAEIIEDGTRRSIYRYINSGRNLWRESRFVKLSASGRPLVSRYWRCSGQRPASPKRSPTCLWTRSSESSRASNPMRLSRSRR